MHKNAETARLHSIFSALVAGLPALVLAGCSGAVDASESPTAVARAELSPQSVAPAVAAPVGAVYVASNSYAGNRVLSFLRGRDGSLSAGPSVPTGGLGSGEGWLVPNDPLGSQHSLIVDPSTQLLFAVNAGSNDVAVLAVGPKGLTRVDLRSSHGVYPVSLAFQNGTLYVLNALSNSLAGYKVDPEGHLSDLQTCDLPALPALEPSFPGSPTQSAQPVPTETAGQVGFSPDGKKLLVVSKEGPMLPGFPFGDTTGRGRIHVYDVDDDGRLSHCARPTTTVLPLNGDGKGMFPFSFAWDDEGQLLLTEVFGVGTSPTAPGSAVSSFALGGDGSLTRIKGPVGSGQVAVCWIVTHGKLAYTANFLSNDLSSYWTTNPLQLLSPEAALLAAGSLPTDMAITDDGRFVYQLATGASAVQPFVVVPATGVLTALPTASDGQDWAGYQGIATVDFPHP